jgi:acyl-CoA synthetase (AMP-forming)/AMP-acid ligase II
LASELFRFTRDDVIYMGSPLAHQTGFLYATLFGIYQGCKCVLQDIWDPVEASRLIATERCTITLGSTPFLSDLVRTPAARSYDTSCLRLFPCAGAPIPRVLVEDAQQSHPNLYVMSAWGMTEMGITTATYPGDAAEKVLDTDGRALPHQAVRVIDDKGTLLPPGVEGRLQARCVTTFVGYLKRPEVYGVDAAGWIETGDNARMDADGLHPHHRPIEGHHHSRRREHSGGGGGGAALPPPGHRGRRRGRHARCPTWRARLRLRHTARRPRPRFSRHGRVPHPVPHDEAIPAGTA